MTRTAAADAVMPACRHAAAARSAEAFTAIACTGPAAVLARPGVPACSCRAILPARPENVNPDTCARLAGTAGGTSQHSLDGHLIPEGTSKCLLISPPRWFQWP